MNYIGSNGDGRRIQQRVLGIDRVQTLFEEIPAELRYPHIDVPDGMSEARLRRRFADSGIGRSSSIISPQRSFAGAGFYHHYIPAAVDAILSDGSFFTAYTPYQAEASQGTLQALFEYQTYMAELIGMDVVNASHYDGATALAEAVRLAASLSSVPVSGATENASLKNAVFVIGAMHPEHADIVRTYCGPLGLRFEYFPQVGEFRAAFGARAREVCAVVAVSPDFFGTVHELAGVADEVHGGGSVFIVHTDPLACAVLRTPGSLGADIATGEGQPLGIPRSYGGPGLGIFAVSDALVRRLPGRLCGETVDNRGNRMFVLTLSTREQHIRREKAVSNICTNQGLMALRCLVHMALVGPAGLERAARMCVDSLEYFREKIARLPGFALADDAFHFRECLLRLPANAQEIHRAAAEAGFNIGVPLSLFEDSEFADRSDDLLIAVTEIHSRSDIDELVEVLGAAAGRVRKELSTRTRIAARSKVPGDPTGKENPHA